MTPYSAEMSETFSRPARFCPNKLAAERRIYVAYEEYTLHNKNARSLRYFRAISRRYISDVCTEYVGYNDGEETGAIRWSLFINEHPLNKTQTFYY